MKWTFGLLAAAACLLLDKTANAQDASSYSVLENYQWVSQEKKPPPKGDKQKDKDKKPPEVAQAMPLPALDLTPTVLPLAPEMLGDVGPIGVQIGGPGAAGRIPLLATARWFKVADNGSPRPQDRVYASFQYYNDVFGSSNRASSAAVHATAPGPIDLYREYVGIEKTFFAGNASIELRLPLDSVTMQSRLVALNGTHTTLGDLGIALRYALYRDDALDKWFTVGLALTAPTGPNFLGGIAGPPIPHSTNLQPFAASLCNHGSLYVQAFSAIDVPTDSDDVTLWYNDLCVGYFVYRTNDFSRCLTAFAPAFEAHVTTPLDNHNASRNAIVASDVVNLGAVANFQFFNCTRLSAGVVTPVTGPRPFSVEALVQLRLLY
jgi:hypothetical protein